MSKKEKMKHIIDLSATIEETNQLEKLEAAKTASLVCISLT